MIITDVKEFLHRINLHLPGFCYSPIHYIDYSNLFGKTLFLPILKKDYRKFKHQQEFRLYNHKIAITRQSDFNFPGVTKIPGIEINGTLAERFPTEDMSDIIINVPTDQVFKGVLVDLKIDWNYCHKNKLKKDS